LATISFIKRVGKNRINRAMSQWTEEEELGMFWKSTAYKPIDILVQEEATA
jgi:hypothetical protein